MSAGKAKKVFLWFWKILLIISLALNLYQTRGTRTNFDESGYKKRVDSLNLIIARNDSMNNQIEKQNTVQEEQIGKLNNRLKDINKKYKHYENLYEESMDSLAHMSDNDVSHLFANTFKWLYSTMYSIESGNES